MRTQFGDFEQQYYNPDIAKITILPVPFDTTSTWIKGADKGPQAILNASFNLEFYDIETDSEVFKEGIFTESAVEGFIDPEPMTQAVRDRVSHIFDRDKFPVVLGGEHSVSIGAIQAASEHFENLTVLQLDAHSDLRDSYEGSAYNHACVMARVKGYVPIVQVGIRSMDACEKPNMDIGRIFFAHDVFSSPTSIWIDQVISLLTENVYVTIDLDVFDPSIMPATGTPEPGGMTWYEMTALMRKVNAVKNVVGFDIVELCPRDNLWSCDFLAAKLLYKILTYKFCI